ncbi:PTS fructose transporter subunit IIB [Streptomyces enissocaesilis]|uniref:PTS EIIB type-2 domain-containing protein n=1 Tax=Streptomyces enissocaesilis TaxID=332589 RepID=A0ABP6JWT4_9ACTN
MSGQKKPKLLAVSACPTGIAHTYTAAEKLTQAAEGLGADLEVETQGSIGAGNTLSDNGVGEADGVIIAAGRNVDRSRFTGKRVPAAGTACRRRTAGRSTSRTSRTAMPAGGMEFDVTVPGGRMFVPGGDRGTRGIRGSSPTSSPARSASCRSRPGPGWAWPRRPYGGVRRPSRRRTGPRRP